MNTGFVPFNLWKTLRLLIITAGFLLIGVMTIGRAEAASDRAYCSSMDQYGRFTAHAQAMSFEKCAENLNMLLVVGLTPSNNGWAIGWWGNYQMAVDKSGSIVYRPNGRGTWQTWGQIEPQYISDDDLWTQCNNDDMSACRELTSRYSSFAATPAWQNPYQSSWAGTFGLLGKH